MDLLFLFGSWDLRIFEVTVSSVQFDDGCRWG